MIALDKLPKRITGIGHPPSISFDYSSDGNDERHEQRGQIRCGSTRVKDKDGQPPKLDHCGKLVRSSIRIDTEQDLTSLQDPVSFFIFHESYIDRHYLLSSTGSRTRRRSTTNLLE